MTRTTNARLAGFLFLFYIAAGMTSLVLFNQATAGAPGTAAKLASIARHEALVRLTAVITLLTFVIAVVLAVALYALTREQDRDLAMIALCCRAAEGVIAASSAVQTLQLLSVATASTAGASPGAAAAQALGALLLKQDGWSSSVAATCFAVGSMLYSYLFLRARSIPVLLAWLGVVASVLLVVLLPVQLAGFLEGPVTNFMWIPMAVFEVTLGFWLLIKGVAPPVRR
ncbi:MAG TPA: DUF4386 domain-containing protein [Gemmatimonadales bacterium]|jgi:hypothetical protein|nr:DUF4386 domain-containing protein [Gemmatimonadales bacterium]